MIEFHEILNTLQAMAIANKLSPNEASLYRSICREYSVKYNTALYLVEDMDPEHVMLNVFEGRLEDIDERKKLDKIMDSLYRIEDPKYESKKKKANEDSMDEAVKRAEAREKERIEKEKSSSEKTLLESEEEVPENQLTGGSVDFSSLSEDEEQ